VVLQEHVRIAAKISLGAVLKMQPILLRNGPEHPRKPGATDPVVGAMDYQPPIVSAGKRSAAGAPKLPGDPPCTPLHEISKAHSWAIQVRCLLSRFMRESERMQLAEA
jgi:hypothetical protein